MNKMNDLVIPFEHRMFAHCESGTVTGLLNHGGLPLTEPMVFGISSGILFLYFKTPALPFPTFVVRNFPGQMIRGVSRRLGVKFSSAKYRDQKKGEEAIDALLDKGIPVACRTDFYYMDYLPAYMRAHFNFHYLTIVGRKGSKFLVSDCYSTELAELERESLRKGRYPGGSFDPRGFLFYPVRVPQNPDIDAAIRKGIKAACFNMLRLPVKQVGVKGIRLFSKKIMEWPGMARNEDHLSHEIMKINILLEDQGTGGAGYRFMYATFLRQASEKLNAPALREMSERMMLVGDDWRRISIYAARMGKNHDFGETKFRELSEKIARQADAEEKFFTDLARIAKTL
ncbi:MAG TPA: BtrH N-terminal domain-containing protein [Spirochaetota bacterium]|nr:BtrH N-terminal domain-containing protein [Spirochaetota bacterium]